MTVSDMLEQLATSLMISTRLLETVTACSILADNLGQTSRTQTVDGLLVDLLQAVRYLCVQSTYYSDCRAE